MSYFDKLDTDALLAGAPLTPDYSDTPDEFTRSGGICDECGDELDDLDFVICEGCYNDHRGTEASDD